VPRIKLPSPRGHITAGPSHSLLNADLPDDYTSLSHAADQRIRDLTEHLPRVLKMYELLQSDPRALAHWTLANYLTVGKLNYNDHGPIHARVTCAYAMELMTLLAKANVPFDVVESEAGDLEDAFLVVLAGILLHDIGNALHRYNHEAMSVNMARPILSDLLAQIYNDVEQRTLMEDFILSSIECHDINPPPLYMEAAVVAVADGCDMTKGRARMPFDLGKIDIHAVSALSIEDVRIEACEECEDSGASVQILVMMSNSAGIFQVEETLVKKLLVTPLKRYVTVKAMAIEPNSPYDRRILQSVSLRNGRLTPT